MGELTLFQKIIKYITNFWWALNIYLFGKCVVCGKGFKWLEHCYALERNACAPILFFRKSKNIAHEYCENKIQNQPELFLKGELLVNIKVEIV